MQPLSGQESVWDYPRPPIVRPDPRRIIVEFGGAVIARTTASLKVLETSHPPVFYLPESDVEMAHLRPSSLSTWCEFKGEAAYWSVVVGDRVAEHAAWGYPRPAHGYEDLRGHIAFYPARMDNCSVDDVQAVSQEGDFYGGWITPEIVGPFKGAPGTRGW